MPELTSSCDDFMFTGAPQRSMYISLSSVGPGPPSTCTSRVSQRSRCQQRLGAGPRGALAPAPDPPASASSRLSGGSSPPDSAGSRPPSPPPFPPPRLPCAARAPRSGPTPRTLPHRALAAGGVPARVPKAMDAQQSRRLGVLSSHLAGSAAGHSGPHLARQPVSAAPARLLEGKVGAAAAPCSGSSSGERR